MKQGVLFHPYLCFEIYVNTSSKKAEQYVIKRIQKVLKKYLYKRISDKNILTSLLQLCLSNYCITLQPVNYRCSLIHVIPHLHM